MPESPEEPPGTAEAIAAARALASRDAAFEFDHSERLPQGANNRILAGRYEDRPVVFKYFDDRINKPGAAKRMERERFALRHWRRQAEIPVLEFEGPNYLLIQRFPGRSFSEVLRETPGHAQRALLDRVGAQVGDLYARLAETPLHNLEVDPVAECEALLARCEALAPRFSEGEFTLPYIRAQLPRLVRERPVLYRYDNNFGNLILNHDQLVGLVDFEQCYIGTESRMLGAMLDTMPEIYPAFPNRPAWPVMRDAYEQRRGQKLDDEQMAGVLAMAMLNHWQRIHETLEQKGTLDRYLDRFQVRFPVLRQMAARLNV